jgi:hypothetical protein
LIRSRFLALATQLCFETIGFGFEFFGRAQPRLPNCRLTGAFGIFVLPHRPLA